MNWGLLAHPLEKSAWNFQKNRPAKHSGLLWLVLSCLSSVESRTNYSQLPLVLPNFHQEMWVFLRDWKDAFQIGSSANRFQDMQTRLFKIATADRTKHKAHHWLKEWIELLFSVINISIKCQTVSNTDVNRNGYQKVCQCEEIIHNLFFCDHLKNSVSFARKTLC